MKCGVPICEKEIRGEGHTHGLGDGQHNITICDECEGKFQNHSPEYVKGEFVWVPRRRTGKKLCIICKVEEVRGWGSFDKCFICALNEKDRLYADFINTLSPEQLELLRLYEDSVGRLAASECSDE